MTETIRGYFMALIAAAMLSGIALRLTPEGAVRRVTTLVAGLVMLLAVMQPITHLDASAMARSIAEIGMEADAARSGVEVRTQEATAAVIKSKCEAYIADKASSLGARVTAEVTLSGEVGAYPYPSSVVLSGAATASQRAALGQAIAENLAIPKEKQVWK